MGFRDALGVALAIGMISTWSADVAATDNVRTRLSGSEEVPVAATRGRGEAIFQLSGPDGDALRFRRGVVNIQNVVAAIENFRTRLSGAEEVPPVDTRARGRAIFELRSGPDGDALLFRLNVANIQNVVAAHIHLAPAGENGEIVAFLFGPVPPALGRFRGVLAAGAITDGDLVGPLAGQPLEALINEMEVGNTYVNVHTDDGVDPPNTGPGDFPGGEIRGQID